MKRERMDSVRDVVRQGIRPALPEPFASDHKSVIVKAFRQAMDLCFHNDPEQRGTTKQVARVLYETLQDMQQQPQELELSNNT
jgi:hypothetical protein